MALPASRIYFTPEEYLAFERAAEERHEYSDGHIFLMAGEGRNHSRICVNLAREVSAALKGKPCEAFSPNMKVRGSRATKFSYPDLTVVCGEPIFHDDYGDVLVNAKVIFEVLSPSTEAQDRGKKFLRYQSIETFTDYVLVSQDEPFVEHRARQPNGQWLLTTVTGLESSLRLASVDCLLRLAEIYDRVVFPPPESEDDGSLQAS